VLWSWHEARLYRPGSFLGEGTSTKQRIRAVTRHPELAPEKVESAPRTRWIRLPDCMSLVATSAVHAIELPDPDDRHVVAAAIRAKAQVSYIHRKGSGSSAGGNLI